MFMHEMLSLEPGSICLFLNAPEQADQWRPPAIRISLCGLRTRRRIVFHCHAHLMHARSGLLSRLELFREMLRTALPLNRKNPSTPTTTVVSFFQVNVRGVLFDDVSSLKIWVCF